MEYNEVQLKDFKKAELELSGEEKVFISQKDKTRNTLLSKIKDFIIGTNTMGTTATDVTGAVKELNDKIGSVEKEGSVIAHLNENVKNIKKLNGTNNYVSDLNNCSITGEKITVKTNESTLNTPYKVGITGLTIGSVDIYNLDINFELQIYNAFGSVNRYVRSKNNGTWSDWSILKDIDSGWLNLPLGSGIIVDGGLTPQYRKIGNRVFIRGSVKNIVTGNTVIGTLPVGFRPVLQNHHYATFTNTNACTSFNISTDGRIIYQGNSTNTFNAEWFVVITNNFII